MFLYIWILSDCEFLRLFFWLCAVYLFQWNSRVCRDEWKRDIFDVFSRDFDHKRDIGVDQGMFCMNLCISVSCLGEAW